MEIEIFVFLIYVLILVRLKKALFIALNGTLSDGHDFIEMAINNGASAIVCEKIPLNINETVVYVLVKDSSKALGHISANFMIIHQKNKVGRCNWNEWKNYGSYLVAFFVSVFRS